MKVFEFRTKSAKSGGPESTGLHRAIFGRLRLGPVNRPDPKTPENPPLSAAVGLAESAARMETGGAAEIRMDGTTPANGLGPQPRFSVLCPFGRAMGLRNLDEVGSGKAYRKQGVRSCWRNQPTLKVRRVSDLRERKTALVAPVRHQGRGQKPQETCASAWCVGKGRQVVMRPTGAGEGIRTLDPNLGKVVLYP